ncbi:MAG: hypothetical protein WD040_05055 [Anaerolineales bacterium]
MATRIDAMALPGVTTRSVDLRRRLRQIGVVIVGAGLVGLGFALLYLVNVVLHPAAISVGAALAIGLASGLGARIWLRDATSGLRMACALAAGVIGQAFLGWLTWGFAGVYFSPAAQVEPDWSGVLRVVLGGVAAVLGLGAWTAPRFRLPRSESPDPPARATVAVPPAALREPLWTRAVERIRKILSRPSRPQVHLTGRVEHRCPYCLEPVTARDPRGEVTCPVCHSRHHADCWAVTGVCQVPHHNV